MGSSFFSFRLPSRRFFLFILILCLCGSALLGIAAIIFNGLGDVGAQVLATTGVIDGAAILALCCAGVAKSTLQRVIKVTGFICIAISLVITVWLIWDTNIGWDWIAKTAACAGILAIACAHACLILPVYTYSKSVRVVVSATIACIAIAAGLIIYPIAASNFDLGDTYVKAIGVVLILDVLGTIVAIVLRKFTKPDAVALTPLTSPSLIQPGAPHDI